MLFAASQAALRSSSLSGPLAVKPAGLPFRSFKHVKLAFLQQLEDKTNAFIVEPAEPIEAEDQIRPSHVGKVAVKDNICSSTFPTTCASKILEGNMSPYNANVLDYLESKRAVIVGKTNMDAFGMGSHSTHSNFGPVYQPDNRLQLSPGGSSGGSAVAVVLGKARIALGSDTGGSIRLPAAYTGTVGIKPSYGRISRWGLVPYANSLDTIGVFLGSHFNQRQMFVTHEFLEMGARDRTPPDPTSLSKRCRRRIKRSINTYVQILSGPPEIGSEVRAEGKPLRIPSRFLRPLRIGVPLEYNTEEVSQAVRSTWQQLLEMLQEQGHQVVPISLPSTKYALSAYYIIAAAEAASNLAKYDGVRYCQHRQYPDGGGGVLYSRTRCLGFGEEVQRRILLGNYTLSSKAMDNHFIQAQKIRRLVQQDFDRVFALPNFLRDPKPIDLSDLDESITLEDRKGPSEVDLIVCPTAPTLPPSRDDIRNQSPTAAYVNDVFTVPASMAGLPAVSIPITLDPTTKFPVGMQLIGQFFDDHFVVDMAHRIADALRSKNFGCLRAPMKKLEIYSSYSKKEAPT